MGWSEKRPTRCSADAPLAEPRRMGVLLEVCEALHARTQAAPGDRFATGS